MRARLTTLLIALLGLATPGCETTYYDHWSGLSRGMTKPEVETLLGAPRTRFVSPDAEPEVLAEPHVIRMTATEAEIGYAERWVYGTAGLGLTAGLEQAFKYTSGNAYHVYFDADGRVIDYQRPPEPQPGDEGYRRVGSPPP